MLIRSDRTPCFAGASGARRLWSSSWAPVEIGRRGRTRTAVTRSGLYKTKRASVGDSATPRFNQVSKTLSKASIVSRAGAGGPWVAGLNAARDREIEKSGVGAARRPERGCCSLCFGSKRAPERDPLVQY